MFLSVAFQADWTHIADRKQRLIVQNNRRENKSRREHTYHVDDLLVMMRHDPSRKHGDDTYKGPYPITIVCDNGTVQLRQTKPSGNAVLVQTCNIRKIRPYVRPDQPT